MSDFTPIQTRYKGYHFRSRLEARWAVFFDSLEIKWEYEPQGFQVPGPHKKGAYLPDFHLPELGTWVEVKGSLDQCPDDYFEMLSWAIDYGGHLPGINSSGLTTRGVLWLGPIPDMHPEHDTIPLHPILQHDKGGWISVVTFAPRRIDVVSIDYDNPFSGGDSEGIRPVIDQLAYNDVRYVRSAAAWQIRSAYVAARSARFEHGQCGAT